MVCSLKIKVIDILQPIQVSSEVELSFTLTDSSPNSYMLKSSERKEMMLMNKNDTLLSVYLIFAYIAILLVVFIIVFGFLFYNIKSKRMHIITDQKDKTSKDKHDSIRGGVVEADRSPSINKVNMNRLFKWFDQFSSTETPYADQSTSSASCSTTSTTSCDSSLDRNLIESNGKQVTILTRTSTKLFNKLDPKQNSGILIFFKSKLKVN